MQDKPDDGDCIPQSGAAGFDITVTRVFKDLKSGAELRRENFNTHYIPEAVIHCVAAPADPAAPPAGTAAPAGGIPPPGRTVRAGAHAARRLSAPSAGGTPGTAPAGRHQARSPACTLGR